MKRGKTDIFPRTVTHPTLLWGEFFCAPGMALSVDCGGNRRLGGVSSLHTGKGNFKQTLLDVTS